MNELPDDIDPIRIMEGLFRVRLADGTLVPFKAEPFQRRFFEAGPLYGNNKIRIINKSRKLGYTMLWMMEAIVLAVKRPGTFYPFAAVTEEQATRSVDMCRQLMRDSALPFRKPEKDNTTSVKLPNGSEIKAFSGTRPDSARGDKAFSVSLDEFAHNYFPQETLAAFSPFLVQGGTLTITSTPNGVSNEYWKMVTEAKAGNVIYSYIEQPIFENMEKFDVSKPIPEQVANGLKICAWWISPESLERDRVRDQTMFMQEYCCSPSESSYALYPREEIEEAIIPGTWEYVRQPMGYYFTGSDFALSTQATADYSVTMVGKVDDKDGVEVVYISRVKGQSTPDQLEELHSLYRNFQPVTMNVERNNMGAPIFQMLQLKVPVVNDFNTTPDSKRAIIRQLQEFLHNKKLRVRTGLGKQEQEYVEQWKREMMAFSRIENKLGTNYTLRGAGNHDDMVMATAIMLQAVLEWRGGISAFTPIMRSPDFWGPVNTPVIESERNKDRQSRHVQGSTVRVVR